ncbi:MAG: hypothetical protein Q8P18_03880 [Pseudomonadota bacterium]|nr:hypothetical protein [Pseudomonadota bacterium]
MRITPPLLLASLVMLLACASFGGDTASEDSADTGTPAVDLLFVIDNSDSMQEEATELAGSLELLEDALADAGVTTWRAGITTSSVFYDDGPTADIDPGEAGTLVGGTTVATVAELREHLLCGATCWDQSMPSDPDYVCGDALVGAPSEEYLDCECGAGVWRGNCGTGQEQPIEAAYIAMCRTMESPPEDCYTFTGSAAVAFEEGDERSNVGLGDVATLVIVVSDEGDSSLRTESGEAAAPGDVDTVVNAYTALFAALPNAVRVSTIGPAWDGTDGSCLNAAQEWGVDRYLGLAASTDGFYEPLTDMDGDCAPRPMDAIVAAIATAAAE